GECAKRPLSVGASLLAITAAEDGSPASWLLRERVRGATRGAETSHALGRIGAVDKQVRDPEAPRQGLAQPRDAITLGGVMAGREEAQAILSRAVHRWLGDFAGQVGIHARGYRLVDVALGAARAPAHATNRAVPFDHQRLAVQFLMHQPHE